MDANAWYQHTCKESDQLMLLATEWRSGQRPFHARVFRAKRSARLGAFVLEMFQLILRKKNLQKEGEMEGTLRFYTEKEVDNLLEENGRSADDSSFNEKVETLNSVYSLDGDNKFISFTTDKGEKLTAYVHLIASKEHEE